MKRIFTIGHSTQSFDSFLSLLEQYNINCIVDVRSTPYSQYATQYNQDILSSNLKKNDVYYLFMGEEFGARRRDPRLYTSEGFLDFDKVSKTTVFKKGIERIVSGVDKGYNVAFMCTEKEPIDCHRTILVGHEFFGLGFEILNILSNGQLLSQRGIDTQLLDLYFPYRRQGSLFDEPRNEKDLLTEAYRFRNRDIGYRIHVREE